MSEPYPQPIEKLPWFEYFTNQFNDWTSPIIHTELSIHFWRVMSNSLARGKPKLRLRDYGKTLFIGKYMFPHLDRSFPLFLYRFYLFNSVLVRVHFNSIALWRGIFVHCTLRSNNWNYFQYFFYFSFSLLFCGIHRRICGFWTALWSFSHARRTIKLPKVFTQLSILHKKYFHTWRKKLIKILSTRLIQFYFNSVR